MGKKTKTIYFSQIASINMDTDVFDKLFNTGKIVLEPGFLIKSIKDTNQMYIYIQRLIQYAKRYQGNI